MIPQEDRVALPSRAQLPLVHLAGPLNITPFVELGTSEAVQPYSVG